MTISLQNIIPTPLKDRLAKQSSDIWNKNIQLSNTQYTKIIAPSGTGKTTLMNILYGLRNDYEGNILYNNENIRSISVDTVASIRQTKLSVVFQDLRLFPQLTAKENIDLKRTMQTPLYNEDKIDAMAETLGITHILQQQTAKCSYGEQQRIAIIRALMQPFELMLLDEPFSHLDSNNTQKAATLIMQECAARKAGFVITDLDDDKNFEYTQVFKL